MKIGLQSWGSEGDVQPFIALAAGFAPRGHQVTRSMIDLTHRDHSAVARGAGFSLQPIANRDLPNLGEFQLPRDDMGAFDQDKRAFKVQWTSHRKIFPKCATIVHHWGAGTTQSSLLAGRPAVVVGHIADQFHWGSELEKLGVAGRSQNRRGLSPAALACAISVKPGPPSP